MLNNKTYDILKYVALIGIPVLATFLTTIGDIWNIGLMPKIVATIMAIATLLGSLLQLSSSNYKKKGK